MVCSREGSLMGLEKEKVPEPGCEGSRDHPRLGPEGDLLRSGCGEGVGPVHFLTTVKWAQRGHVWCAHSLARDPEDFSGRSG